MALKRKKKKAKSKIIKKKKILLSKPRKKAKATASKKNLPTKKSLNEILVGKVTHYFPKVKAAVIKITKDGLKLGSNVHLKGHTTDFKQNVDSIQIDRVPVKEAKKGMEIGLRVASRVRENDQVYLVK
ncbi:MAG: hypothetical protein Q8O13_03070 [Candidatus Omnitrophota bacterium]|nr:hypothetical protein [Candidatus Omnitrophota bacterium]